MAEEMRRTVAGPLLFKLRVLETREETAEFMTMLAGEGADALVVHGRRAGGKIRASLPPGENGGSGGGALHSGDRQRRRLVSP